MEVVLTICKYNLHNQKMVLSLLFVKMKNSDHKIKQSHNKRETFVL